MPSPGNQFLTYEFGDIEDYFVSDYWLMEQFFGDRLFLVGNNSNADLGVNDINNRSTPVTTFAGGNNWKQSSIGSSGKNAAATKTDGTLWLWGNNSYGQIGVNDLNNRSTPVTTFLGGTNWNQISVGNECMAAIKTDGTLWTWGRNLYGNLGINSSGGTNNRTTPVTTLSGGTNWKQVSLKADHVMAVKTDGTLWGWGWNTYGQLGVNDTTDRPTPVTTILGGTNWRQVYAGGTFTAAIKTDGTLWTWGRNNAGQLGVNDTTQRNTPVTTILGGTNWKQVGCGDLHAAAIKTDGTLWAWGENQFGQLGTNDTTQRNTPVTTFAGGTNWAKINCGVSFTASIKTDGSLWVWGRNNSAQLGVNDTTQRNTPVTTFTGGNNWKQVACGLENLGAITAGVDVDLS